MLHTKRTWSVEDRHDTSQLAEELSEYHYALNQAFRTPAGTLWVNDSCGEEGLQEYAVLRPDGQGGFRQVESVTVSWCDALKLDELLARADSGTFDDTDYEWGRVDAARLVFCNL